MIECGPDVVDLVPVILKGRNNFLRIEGGKRRRLLRIMFECDNAECVIAEHRLVGKIRLGERWAVRIGKGLTCTRPCYLSTAEMASVHIGGDCLFASRDER